ncbi:MAG: hypothetical protein ACOYXY_15970 [Thermodesulfobacteriota bacterium]
MKAPSLEELEWAAACGATAVYFLVIGLRSILVWKPFLVSERWLQGIWFYWIAVAILRIIQDPPDPGLADAFIPYLWRITLILLAGVAFGCLLFRGYVAFGVTDQSFREAMLHSLKQMNLPYQETPSAVSITTLGVDLQVSVSWHVGRLKTKQWGFGTTLSDIARGMNRYYEAGAVSKGNLTNGIAYTILGLCFAGAALLRFA